jgi:hypothetical protein
MMAANLSHKMPLKPVRWFFLLVLLFPFLAHAVLEQSFEALQIGTTTYRNVTVTTKNKNYVFILHSQGMTNLKVADLSPELRTKLGYEDPNAPKANTNAATAWARQTFSKLDVPQVKVVGERLSGLLHGALPMPAQIPSFSRNQLLEIAGGLIALYLLHCYCCLLICQKAGATPGFLIWIPLLQLFPLLKAAGMPPVWFLGFLVPGVNLIAHIVWCVKISAARGKSLFVGLLLIFPLSSPFAALYLAFSGSPRSSGKQRRRVEIMTLETA